MFILILFIEIFLVGISSRTRTTKTISEYFRHAECKRLRSSV